VQNAINSASEGGTVTIPSGACTWTGGVTVSGKGLNITGAGTSRIIAIASTSSPVPLSTGSLTLTIQGADPGNPTPNIAVGSTLMISETGTPANYLTGTVTSFTSSSMSLVINITGIGGACGSNSLSNCKRWLISTVPSTYTAIVDNNSGSSGPLFQITEDTSVNTQIGNIWFKAGTYSDNAITIGYASGGKAVIVHDCRVDDNGNNPGPPSGNATMILVNSIRGLVYNCSFQAYPYNLSTLGAISVQDSANLSGNSWTSASNMGSLSNGTFEFYAEDNDYHAMNYATSTDNNGRATWRYSLYDNAGIGTHGADTSGYGQRYFELYNNTFVFEGYNDGSTFNVNDWIYLRGGTGLVYNNTIPALLSTDYGTKSDVNMTVMNLQRNAGPDPCWGASASTYGGNYHAPRQVGFGRVTGSGSASYTGASPNAPMTVSGANDSVTYVGDSEPFYIWGNSRSQLNVAVSDYGGADCSNPDSSTNYIQSGRDYFNGSTAKPGWSSYTYPNPLRSGTVSSKTPGAPTTLQAAPPPH
jgi:hypothetical protein